MEKPLCKLCGKRHYGMCAAPQVDKPETEVEHPKPEVQKPIAKEKFDRNKYQRELMRKRRAAAKSTKETPE
jgi:hypothetical protein